MTNSETAKKPLKYVQMAISNFQEEAIPYHLNLLKENKAQINNDSNNIKIQEKNIKKIETQLKNLSYELETLRTRVQDDDLDKFDMKTMPLRKCILQIINEYKELKLILQKKNLSNIEINERLEENVNEDENSILQEPLQLKTSVNINELKIKEKEARLQNIETINDDIKELHTMYKNLNEIVHDQGQLVDTVENNVETTHVNVEDGTKSIIYASRLKAATYPVAGAVMGGILGGPVGLVAGVKIGGLAAIGCGCLGYFGGKFYKHKVNDSTDSNKELHSTEIKENEIVTDCHESKKDE